MKKILKSRVLYAVLAFILAAVVIFYVIPTQYDDFEATTKIVKVTKDVKEGTVLSSDMLVVVDVGAYGLSSSAITDINEAVGKVALNALDARNPIYKDDLVSQETYGKGGGMESLIGEDQSLISVTMSNAASSVAGLAKPGDHVDVFYAHTGTDESGANVTTAYHPDLLKDMVIYSVMNSNLSSTSATSETVNTDPIPAVVTFIATAEQQAELVRLEHSSSDEIHLTLLKGGE